MRDLSKYLLNDKAKAKVRELNKRADAFIQTGADGDANLKSYKAYVKKFNELKELYPNFEGHLDEPIPYSQFVLDYNENIFKNLKMADERYKNLSTPEYYALKMHGINEAAIDILEEKLGELLPGSEWTNPAYFRSHLPQAFQLLRSYFPNDEEYDSVFSPKETMISFG